MITIGLIGAIGTGKSTVASMLADLGATIINADQIGHAVYLPHTPAWQEVVATFGQEVLQPDGTINRRRLGEIVFADPAALQKLNSIVHPRMYNMIKEQLDELRRQGVQVAVLEAAILLEAHWESLVDRIWCTIAPEEEIIRRLSHRFTAEEVRSRLAAQMSQEERARHAHVVIDTACSLPELRRRVEALWNQLQQEMATVPSG